MQIRIIIRMIKGGLWADGSNFSVHDCNFSFNSSYQGGAGAYLIDTQCFFVDCYILSLLRATGSGAAVYFEDSNVSFLTNFHYEFKSDAVYLEFIYS